MIVQNARPDAVRWLADQASLVLGPTFQAIEARGEDGRIHGAVGFDGWTENAVCLHVALANPLALRSLLRIGFGIAFKMRGVALAQVLGSNTRSLRLVERLGFKPLCRVRDGWAKGVDMAWFEMRREDCRWLKEA